MPRIDERLLPVKMKFKKFDKHPSRNDQLALSLPTSTYSSTYVNARLARYFADNDITRVNVYTDPEGEAIGLEPTTDTSGFAIVKTGDRGRNITAKLRKVMPFGRYCLMEDESKPNLLIFRKEQITVRYKGKEKSSE